MSGLYAQYDHAWKTPGWTVQDPVVTYYVDGYVDPGMPEDVTLIKVYGSFLEFGTGRNLEGVVQFRVDQVLTHVSSGQQVMPGVIRKRFRKDGFAIYLPATDDPELLPEGFKYECRLTVRGHTQEFTFELPSATPDLEVNIMTLVPAEA